MLVSGQNALRTYRRNWPLVPGLADPVRPIRQVVALEHFEKDLALYLDAHPGYLDCGTDPLVDGNCEAVGVAAWPPASDPAVKDAAIFHDGLQSLRLDNVTLVNRSVQNTGTPASGTWIRLQGWARGDGVGIPAIYTNSGVTLVWLGLAAAVWQFFDVLFQINANVRFYTIGNVGVSCWWDSLLCTPMNVTTWIDRTRRGGRNPTQAVSASMPMRMVGGLPSSRDSIYYDGNAQRLKAPAFTLNQTESVNVVFRHAFQATGRYLLDGNAGDSMALYRPTGLARLDAYASANLAGPAIVTATWYGWTSVFNGAASSSRQGIGAETAGNVGASNAGGFTLGSVGGGGSYWVGDISSVVVLERLASPSEVINLNAAAMRRACI